MSWRKESCINGLRFAKSSPSDTSSLPFATVLPVKEEMINKDKTTAVFKKTPRNIF